MNVLCITSQALWNAETSPLNYTNRDTASTSYVTQSERLPAGALPKAIYDMIVSVSHKPGVHTPALLAELLSSLVPGGRLLISEQGQQVSSAFSSSIPCSLIASATNRHQYPLQRHHCLAEYPIFREELFFCRPTSRVWSEHSYLLALWVAKSRMGTVT